MNVKSTLQLEHMLSSVSTYEEFERLFSEEFLQEDSRTGIYLDNLLYKYDKKASVVSVDSHHAMGYVGKVVNGQTKQPSRDSLIRICITIGSTVEETQQLLKYAGYAPLYVRRKRDVIIWFGIMKGEDLDTINHNILVCGLKPLFKE